MAGTESFLLTKSGATHEALSLAAANVILYGSLGYGYFHFLNLGETARRIRILREIESAPEGLSHQEILQRYSAAAIVERRLGRLLTTGQIVLRDGRYHVARKEVVRMARLVRLLRLSLLGR